MAIAATETPVRIRTRLEFLVKLRGSTLMEIAPKIGISYATLHRITRGHPVNDETQARVEAYFGRSLEDLLKPCR